MKITNASLQKEYVQRLLDVTFFMNRPVNVVARGAN